MKVYKINSDQGIGSLYVKSMKEFDGVLGDIEYQEISDSYSISIIEMPESEFNNLPEFDGF